ncbi:deoxyxylulose-5-phosphate synthase [Prevotella sp. CAG:732]|nr:1-deoxy-D-xylulose-5-phosphate synthase [Prevotella sp. CAG:732]CDD20180.1 deoxyxylulose-5-phosphate synthase [Prevotella sp. CAG:732]
MLLEKIQSPKDVKVLSMPQLHELAQEIRDGILNRDSNIGGHVGPNLGIVETTIAMHYVFNCPEDKFVFDVSHQSYPHKMLTGRAFGYYDNNRFQEISGYSSPAESPEYDQFELGHTSTSISLASGLQKARDIKGTKENIVVLIGDGSLSGGEALEGLDEVGELGTGIIIIVNDNEMSIAENHGGLYKNLALLRETNGKAECNLFRAMGLDYEYVADGNDVETLIKTFQEVKDIDHPIVVHIHTEKGKGYAPAEQNKEPWHWSMPFDIETGKPKVEGGGEDYGNMTAEYLLEEMKKDKHLVAVTSGTPTVAGFFKARREEAGAQHVDVGIAEEQAVAMISGMAKGGIRPVYNVYSTFIQRTYDQIAQDLCINGNPAVINVFCASLYGMNDITHIGFYDIPMLSNIPNLVYLAPTCWEEYKAMMAWGIQQTAHPVAIRVPGGAVTHSDEQFDEDYSELNRFKMTHKGSKVAIVALGAFYGLGKQVAALLKEQKGIDATLINPRYITGLDEEMLESLKADHEKVITLEDGALEGGFGEKIARFYGDSDMKTLCFGIKKGLYDRYDYQQLAKDNELTPEQIVARV